MWLGCVDNLESLNAGSVSHSSYASEDEKQKTKGNERHRNEAKFGGLSPRRKALKGSYN